MNKESLIQAKSVIISALEKSKIQENDKMELVINLYHFLDEDKYNRNIRVLRQEDDKQITIDDYIKTLRKEKKNGNNK